MIEAFLFVARTGLEPVTQLLHETYLVKSTYAGC